MDLEGRIAVDADPSWLFVSVDGTTSRWGCPDLSSMIGRGLTVVVMPAFVERGCTTEGWVETVDVLAVADPLNLRKTNLFPSPTFAWSVVKASLNDRPTRLTPLTAMNTSPSA
jgi:hypothetical protein